MKMSRRAQRMDRHHQRAKRAVGFNLVALMDIFTILVFFLLVHSSDMQELPTIRSIELPESVVETRPRETVLIVVSNDAILLDGRVVGTLDDIQRSEGLLIEPLRAALLQQAERSLVRRDDDADLGEVTIMGDKHIPFSLLKRVMATCTDAGFGQVSLAVTQTVTAGVDGS